MNPHSWHDPHIIRTGKFLLKALYVALGVFLFLFVLFHIAGALYVSSIASKATENFQLGITQDLTYLKEQGDQVAKDESLIKSLIARDSDSLIDITKKEVETRSIGLIGVADSEGVMVSRTFSRSDLGQNVFLTVPAGRVVSQGKSVQSIELTGFGNQLFLTTARPVMHQGKMIGALFANYLANDTYAIHFRDAYLPQGVEVLFYTKDFGVYGDSFSDPEIRKLIASYFNSGSDWIKTESSGKTVSFKDYSFYIVENVVFPGLEQSPGGALIFVPRSDISNILNILIGILTLCFFLFLAFRHHVRSRVEERGWRYYVLLVGVSIPVFILALSALYLQNIGYLKLEHIPYALYNSTLRLQPEFGIYDVNFEQRISVVVDTGDENINAVQIGLLFDTEAIEVKALETASSTCSYVIENTIDAHTGLAKLACVILKSEGERGSLKIADVVVVPKQTGTFTLAFDKEETKVFASDGLGTDVLRMSQSGSYTVDNFDPFLFTTTTQQSFVIFSPSHPNQSRWYNTDTAHFVWRGKQGAVYKYAFDSSPDTVPSNSHTTQDSAVTVPVPGDGIFYFHLQLASGGSTVHYRVQADRTPPSIVSINLSENMIVAGDVVRVSFDGEDVGSGIQKNYYVDLGSHLFLPIGSQLFIPFLEAGDQKVVFRVYDNATNYSEKSQIIHVESKN